MNQLRKVEIESTMIQVTTKPQIHLYMAETSVPLQPEQRASPCIPPSQAAIGSRLSLQQSQQALGLKSLHMRDRVANGLVLLFRCSLVLS